MMAPLRRVKLQELNAHLVCVLCSGYFVDATTIIECLHTFCKTCIVRYLSTSSFCPICDVQVHKTRPLLSLREDRTLQDVVYKLVPGLHQTETHRRHHFYNEHPEAGGDKTEQGLRERRHFFHVDDQISLSLEYLPPTNTTNTAKPLSLSNGQVPVVNKPQHGTSQGSEGQKQDLKDKQDVEKDEKQADDKTTIPKRYLKCPAAVQVSHLEKFVRLKYGLSAHHKVDVMHGGDCLLSDLTLLDVVYMYKWQEDEPLRLFFTISATVTRKRLRSNVMRTRTNVDSEQPVTKVAKIQTPEGEVNAEALEQQSNNKADDQSTLNEETGDDDSMSVDEDPLEQEKRLENADLCTIDTSDIFGSMNTVTFNLPSVPPVKTKNMQQTKANTTSTTLSSSTPLSLTSTPLSLTSKPLSLTSTPLSLSSANTPLSLSSAITPLSLASANTPLSLSSASTTVPLASATKSIAVSKTHSPITSVSTTKTQVAPVPKPSFVTNLTNKSIGNKSAKFESTNDSSVPVSNVESSAILPATTKSPPLSKLSITKTSDGKMTSKFTTGDNLKSSNTIVSTAGKENTSTTNSTAVVTSSSIKPKAPNRVLPKLTATLPTTSNSNIVTNIATVSTPSISTTTVKSTSPKTVTFSLASDPISKPSVVTSVSRTDITPKFVSLAQSSTKTTTTNSVVNKTAAPRLSNSTQLINSIPEKTLSPIIPTKPRLGRPPNASRIAAAALGAARLPAPRGVDMKPPRSPAPAPQAVKKVVHSPTVASLNVQSRLSSISGGPPRTGNAKLTVKRTQDAKIQPPTPNMVSCPSPRPESSPAMTSILSPVTLTPTTTTTAGSNLAITQTSRANAVNASRPNLIFTSRTSSSSISNNMPSKSSAPFSSTNRPIMTSCPSPRPHSVTSTSDSSTIAASQKSTTVSSPSPKPNMVSCPSPRPNMATCPSPRPNMASCPSPRPRMASCPSPRPNMASCPSPRPNLASCPSPRPNMASCPSPRPNMASCPSPRPNMASCPSPRPNMASCPSPRPNMASCPSPRPNMTSCPSPRPNMVSCPSPRQSMNSPQTSINPSTSPLPNMVSCPSPRPNMASCPSPRPNMASCPSPRSNMDSFSPNPLSFGMSSGRPQIPPSPRPHTLATPSPRQTTSRTNLAVSKNSPQPQSSLAAGANITARPTPLSTLALQKTAQPMIASTKTPLTKPSNNKTPKSPRRGGNSPTILSIAQTLSNRAAQQQTTQSFNQSFVKNGPMPITTLAKNTPIASSSPSSGFRSPPASSIATSPLGYPPGMNPALASLAAGGAMGGMNPALAAAYLASQGLASQSLASAYSDPSLQDVATMRNLITLSQTAALLRDSNIAALVQQAQQNQVNSASLPQQPEPAPIDLSPTSKAAPVTALTNGRSKESSTTTNAPSQKSKNLSDKSTKSPRSSTAKSTINISAPTAEVTITKLPSSSGPIPSTTTTGSKSVPPLVKLPKTNTNNTVSITKRPVSSNKYAVAKSPANASLRQIPNPSLLRQQSEVRNNNNNNNKNTYLQTSTTSNVNGKGIGQNKNVKVTGNSPLKETGPLPETSSILKIEHLTRSLPTAAIGGQNQYRFFEGR